MPKNTKGGKGHKRQKNSTNVNKFNPKNVPFRSRSLTDRQYYCKVVKPLGNRRFEVISYETDDEGPRTFLAHKSKSRKRGGYIVANDNVLVSARGFATDDKKVDIIHKYNDQEFDYLKKSNEILITGDAVDDCAFSFDRTGIINDEDEEDIPKDKYGKKKNDDLPFDFDDI